MNYPRVSVVIPCRPDVQSPSALDSLSRIDYPKDKIEIVIEKGRHPSAQRNTGIRRAKGEIIAFIDDDCYVKEEWLKNALKYFENKDTGIIGGPNLTPKNDPFLSQCFGHAMASYFGTAKMSHRYRPTEGSREASEQELILANMLCRRGVFDDGMYFNEALFPNEENEFMNRVKDAGYTIIYSPDVQVYHPRKRTVSGFSRQFFGYGVGRAQQSKIQPSSFKILYLLPSVFGIGLFLIPLSLIFKLNILSTLLILCMMIYLMIATLVSTTKSIKTKDIRLLFILPIIFLILHVSYGLGFIMGSIGSKRRS